MHSPRGHIEEIQSRRADSDNEVLDALAGAIDRLEKAFPGQWHFLMEFIQNADDAGSSTLYIEFTRDHILVCNDGRPFDADDVESICKVGRSSKTYTEKGEDYIGYLGIGFKSVFLISDNPQIYSNGYRFEFDKTAWDNPKSVPWQVYPLWISDKRDDFPQEEFTTGFKIPISSSIDDTMFNKLVDDISAEQINDRTLLFLKNLTEITVRDRVNGITKTITKTQTPIDQSYDKYTFEVIENDTITEENTWIVFRSSARVPETVQSDTMTKRWERDDITTREIMVGFRLDDQGRLSHEEGTAHMGVFSYLPLKEVPSGLNFLVQGDFLTAPGREAIHRKAAWNHWLAGEVYNLIVSKVIPTFKSDPRWKYLFTSVLYPEEVGHDLFETEIHAPLRNYLESNPVLLDHNDIFVQPKNAVAVDKELYEMVSPNDLETLYPDRSVLNPETKAHLQLNRLTSDGPSYNSNLGTDSDMDDLLKLKANNHDIAFFKAFYRDLATYKDSTLSSSNLKRSSIILTEDNELKSPQEVYLRNSSVHIHPELEDQFNLLHPDLVESEIVDLCKSLGMEQLTQAHVQRALNIEELPRIQENWEDFTPSEKIQKTRLCLSLWEDNDINRRDLDFLTVQTKSNEWLPLEQTILSLEYRPDHRIEGLIKEGLIHPETAGTVGIDTRPHFVSDAYLSSTAAPREQWREFFLDLGVEKDTNKADISEVVAIETALRYERAQGREAEALPHYERQRGYDISSDGDGRLIEVKGRQRPAPTITLTQNQVEQAKNEDSDYYIYVVTKALSDPTLVKIPGEEIFKVDWSIQIQNSEWTDIGNGEFKPI